MRVWSVSSLASLPETPYLKRYFCASCVAVWRCRVCSRLNLWEIAVSKTSVHFYHSSGYKCIFYTFPPGFDALSGSLRLAWICPWAISTLFALPLVSVSLSVPLTTSTPLPLSLPPLSLSLSLSLPFPSSYPSPLSGDRQANLLPWHFYRMSRLNYDPGSRIAQNCHMI